MIGSRISSLFNKIIRLGHMRLSQEDYIFDFDYSYRVLASYYPYFRVNKDLKGVDWLGRKEEYRERIRSVKDSFDFFHEMNSILADLNNSHLGLVDAYFLEKLYEVYSGLDPEDWRYKQARIFEKPLVRKAYSNQGVFGLEISSFRESRPINYSNNLSCFDLVDGSIAYISIESMLNLSQDIDYAYEDQILKEYLSRIRDYDALVLDIRNNSGGDSDYWSNYLLPKIIDRDYGHNSYSFIREGELLEDYADQENFIKIDDWIISEFSQDSEALDYIKDFDLYKIWDNRIFPAKDSIRFQGRIYILIDPSVFSSADKLAIFAKETGLARLVGTRTGGDGVATDPFFIDLPRTGYILRFPKELGFTGRGRLNEKYTTSADIFVEDPKKRIRFFPEGQVFFRSDRSINKILDLEEDLKDRIYYLEK